MRIYARVAMQFEVDEKKFNEDPERELREALMSNRAEISDGDNYAPETWNESNIAEDFSFSLGTHRVRIGEK